LSISGTLGCDEQVAQKHPSPGNRSKWINSRQKLKKKLTESKLPANEKKETNIENTKKKRSLKNLQLP
jgi:hypothetical protein